MDGILLESSIECTHKYLYLYVDMESRVYVPVGEPKVWSAMGVLAFCPKRLSQSISSVRAEAPTFIQPHSSTSKVQSPEVPAAVCGAPLFEGKGLRTQDEMKC